MNTSNLEEDNHRARSNFVRELVQRRSCLNIAPAALTTPIPRKIVQFWDDLDQLPEDVNECIETWKLTEQWGVKRILFDTREAKEFINQKLGLRYMRAYEKCYHPAMQSDYFRICYIFIEGGCYIDVDDVYCGINFQYLFSDSRLKVQPLCYDTATHTMVPPHIFTKEGANADSWIFYFNNNPLIAKKEHPIIGHALAQATLSLEKDFKSRLPEIQSTTGPGNLTKSIFDLVIENGEIERTLLVSCDWEETAISKWELSYRNDARNWRLSNGHAANEK